MSALGRVREIPKQRYVDRLHCEFRQEFLEFCEDESVELQFVFQSQREDWIQSLIRDGVGVSVIPRFSLLRPELDYRPVTAPALSRRVEFAVIDKAELTPALEMLIEHASNHDWPVSGHTISAAD
jgi:DNA-binding transcriptional LysR family regulator